MRNPKKSVVTKAMVQELDQLMDKYFTGGFGAGEYDEPEYEIIKMLDGRYKVHSEVKKHTIHGTTTFHNFVAEVDTYHQAQEVVHKAQYAMHEAKRKAREE